MYKSSIFIDHGYTYFFGESKKAAPVKKKMEAEKATLISNTAMIDSDNDGVSDSKDQCKGSPTTDKVDASGCTIFMDDVASVNFLINFDNNKTAIKPEYVIQIEKVANFLNTYKSVNVIIEGHASAIGNDEANKKLSQLRADAVVEMLITKYNISESRLSAIGYGEERLLNKANTKAAHAENRRIIATISASKKTPLKR